MDERALVKEEELRPLTVQEVRWKTGKDGRKRKVLITRALREVKGRTFEKMLSSRLRRLNITILCAPTGMQRQRENKTTYNRKSGKVNWQVEWLMLDDGKSEEPTRALSKVLDDMPLCKAYQAMLDEQNRPAKGQGTRSFRSGHYFAQLPSNSTWNIADALLQEPATGSWVSYASVEDSGMWPAEKEKKLISSFDFFLASPRQRSDQPIVVTRLEPSECLQDALKDTNVLEFPTLYVLPQGAVLPPGFVLGGKDYNTAYQGAKRKDGPNKKGSQRFAKRRKHGDDLEDGEVGSEDDGSVGKTNDDDDDGSQGHPVGLEAGEVVDEQSFGEEDDEDEDDEDDSPTSSSGTDSDDSE